MLAKEYFKKLLSSGNVDETIRGLQDLDSSNEDLKNQLTLISGRFNELVNSIEKGLISTENKEIEYNRINYALIEIIDTLPKDQELDISKISSTKISFFDKILKNRKAIIAFIWGVAIILVIFSMNKVKIGNNIRFDLKASKIQFVSDSEIELQTANIYDFVTLNKFGSIEVPTEKISGLDEFSSYTFIGNEFAHQIQNIKNSESSISFENIQFENINIEKGTDVIIDLHAELKEERLLSLSFSQGEVSGEVVLQDSILFQCTYCSLIDQEEYNLLDSIPFFNGRLESPKNQVLPMPFENSDEVFTINLEKMNEQSHFLSQGEAFKALDIQFEIPDGKGSSISSLQSGSVQFLNQKAKAVTQTTIQSGQFLALKGYENVSFNSILTQDKELIIKISGIIDELYFGNTKNDMKLQNPSWLSWIYHNKLIYLLSAIALLIGLSLWIYYFRRL